MQTIDDDYAEKVLKAKPPKIIEISHVSKVYRLGDQDVKALRNVSLDVREGDFMAIAGSSGSG